MIVIEGTIRVADMARAKSAMAAMVKASRAEAGCIDYAYAEDIFEPGLVRVIERWTNEAAFEAHLKSEHLRVWRESWAALGVANRDLRLYEAEPISI
ncbi:MAG: putative quinol monooxygenase [Pseudomonadota bacterium]